MFCNWNGQMLTFSVSINWRASPVPAAAVIPAPIAYTKVVAVKKLVVGSWGVCFRSCQWCVLIDVFFYLVARVCSLN